MSNELTHRKNLAGLVAIAGLCVAPVLGYGVSVQPTLVLMGVLASIVGFVLISRPTWAVFLVVIGTSFDSISIQTGLATFGAADLASLILVPIWILNRLTSKTPYFYPLGLSVLVGYFAITFVSMMAGVAPSSAYGTYMRLVIYGLTLLAVVDIVRTADCLEKIMIIMAACGLAQAIVSLGIGLKGSMRLSGLVDQPNLLAVKIAFGLFPMAGWFLRSRERVYRVALGACLFIMVFAILLTISRGSYISIILGFLWWFRRARRTAIVFLVTGGIALFTLSRIDTTRVTRIEGRLEFNDSSVVNRAVVAKNAMRAAATKPLLGVGFGQFTEVDQVIAITAEKKRGAHSFYLSVAASTGIPALALFLMFAYLQWRSMSRSIPTYRSSSKRDFNRSLDGRITWIISVFQPLMICHGAGLAIRGSQRLTEWTMLSLYCAIALIAKRHMAASKNQPNGQNCSSETPLGEPTRTHVHRPLLG